MKCRLLRRRRAHLRASTQAPRLPLNYAPKSRARLTPADWRDWRARQKDARALETANLSFCVGRLSLRAEARLAYIPGGPVWANNGHSSSLEARPVS